MLWDKLFCLTEWALYICMSVCVLSRPLYSWRWHFFRAPCLFLLVCWFCLCLSCSRSSLVSGDPLINSQLRLRYEKVSGNSICRCGGKLVGVRQRWIILISSLKVKKGPSNILCLTGAQARLKWDLIYVSFLEIKGNECFFFLTANFFITFTHCNLDNSPGIQKRSKKIKVFRLQSRKLNRLFCLIKQALMTEKERTNKCWHCHFYVSPT